MKKLFLLTIITIFLSSGNAFSQNRISVNAGYGYYLQNSENDLKIMGDKKFSTLFSFGADYERLNILGMHLSLGYNYSSVTEENVIEFPYTGEAGPDIIGSYGADLTFTTHCIDLSYISRIHKNFAFGAGPSFIIINRILEIDEQRINVGGQSYTLGFYDKLASSALGVNGFLQFTLPLKADNKLFVNSKLKFRYAHSIWFDEGIRKLDNYEQEFITSELSAGIGYFF